MQYVTAVLFLVEARIQARKEIARENVEKQQYPMERTVQSPDWLPGNQNKEFSPDCIHFILQRSQEWQSVNTVKMKNIVF